MCCLPLQFRCIVHSTIKLIGTYAEQHKKRILAISLASTVDLRVHWVAVLTPYHAKGSKNHVEMLGGHALHRIHGCIIMQAPC